MKKPPAARNQQEQEASTGMQCRKAAGTTLRVKTYTTGYPGNGNWRRTLKAYLWIDSHKLRKFRKLPLNREKVRLAGGLTLQLYEGLPARRTFSR